MRPQLSGVERQITLSYRQAFNISLRNVMLRLGRAAITGAGIVLGIAFLSSVWTGRVAERGYWQQEMKKEKYQDSAIREREEQAMAERGAQANWLAVMSLIVCGVGITNAMLMSVTERFREIGTMKCLGALDEFIVRLFLIEAAALGLLGSVVGVILGHAVMLVVSMVRHGADIVAKMDWGQMLLYMLYALLIGTFVALLAGLAPAYRAAKMPPAWALRTEI